MFKKPKLGFTAIASTVAVSVLLTAHVTQAQTFQQSGSPGVQVGHSGPGGLTGHFAHSCAPGFSKNGQRKLTGSGMGGVNVYGAGWIDWNRCQTPPITCQYQVQANGRRSHVTPRVELVQVGGNPDQTSATFRVKYLCDYEYRSVNAK